MNSFKDWFSKYFLIYFVVFFLQKKVIQIWSDSRFIEMIHLIGMYGDLENVNLFTREMEEDMSPID